MSGEGRRPCGSQLRAWGRCLYPYRSKRCVSRALHHIDGLSTVGRPRRAPSRACRHRRACCVLLWGDLRSTTLPPSNSSPVLRNRDELGVFFFWESRFSACGCCVSAGRCQGAQATPMFQTSRCSLAFGAHSRRERQDVSLTLWTTLQRPRA